MDSNFGLIHVYHGEGKGKTSTAIGQIIRAAGKNKNCMVIRFLKNNDSGELEILNKIDNIKVINNDKCFGFYFDMNDNEKAETKDYCNGLLDEAFEMCEKEDIDIVMLDEINVCVSLGIIPEEKIIDKLKNKPQNLEVLMTGRGATEGILVWADYETYFECRKHPYTKGINARLGIEL